MTVRTSLAMIKLTSIFFVSTALVFAVKYFEVKNQNQKLKEAIELDKKTYTNDLKEIFDRYDAELLKNKKLTASKINPKNELLTFSKTGLNNKNPLVKNLRIDKNLLKKIDSLKMLLKLGNQDNSLLASQINILVNKNKDLNRVNNRNENIIELSKSLTAMNVYANGIKIVSNNIIETKRFNATEQIKVCFTLQENKATLKGNKDIFVQIINPKNNVVSKNGENLEIGDKSLFYSAKTNIYYDNEELEVCVFVDPNKSDIVKGDYEINILSGTHIIGNTFFTLK
ncbi:hypothetical protein [Flavobacterium sp.]|uniref:hypothetical protein n=1 Tax=Flavobacterium sp. TaxID=239 RepID=UPI00286E6292|nr:hypothetical protein [Flavobacterium sp.]